MKAKMARTYSWHQI